MLGSATTVPSKNVASKGVQDLPSLSTNPSNGPSEIKSQLVNCALDNNKSFANGGINLVN